MNMPVKTILKHSRLLAKSQSNHEPDRHCMCVKFAYCKQAEEEGSCMRGQLHETHDVIFKNGFVHCSQYCM